MPDSFLSFLPLNAENANSVRARFNADANAGLDPADPAFIDTTEGGFFWDATQPAVLEAARLWDMLGTEMVAAMFPGTAWGDYLDLHGETINLPRNDEVQATGSVLFVGPVGTLIATGVQVGTLQADPSAGTPIQFETLASITLAATPGPTNLAATPASTGGTLPTGTFYYVVTAINADGHETIVSNEVSANVNGPTGSVALAWTALAGATAYRIYRGTVIGGETLLASPGGVGLAYTDTGAAAPTATLAPTNSAPIRALLPGTSGNVASGAISQVNSPVSGGPAVSNAQPTSGGADVESDDHYRHRILLEYGRAQGAGNQADYERWALQDPSVGYVTVQPLWNGAGTVRVIITDNSNHPNSTLTVQALQLRLDPVPQQGAGLAPIGALVTVATPTLLSVAVSATVSFDSGYSLDGAGGTIATRDEITAAVEDYLNTLAPGATVVLNHVVARFFLVPGVHDVITPQLNGSGTNVAVGPLQVAEAGAITLA